MILCITDVVSYKSIICMILVYDTPHYKAGHSGGNISSIMHLGLANMLMWQAIKEERDGYSNIGRYRNIINVMLLCVMHGNK